MGVVTDTDANRANMAAACLGSHLGSPQDGPLYTAQVSTGPDGLEIPKDSIWWGLAERGAVHARTRLWNLVGRYVLDDRLKTL